MNGAKLTKKVIEQIEAAGGKAINLIAASKSGNADIIACINGRYCEFEIKGVGDTEKPAQAKKLNATIEAGGIAGFIHFPSQVDKFITYAKLGMNCPLVEAKIKKVDL